VDSIKKYIFHPILFPSALAYPSGEDIGRREPQKERSQKARESVRVVKELNHINWRRSKMITWEDSIERGVKKAKEEKKLVLVDFYNPQ
jgi:hypothetical protein